MRSIILASNSPRRRQLLAGAGYEFRVIAPPTSAEAPLNPRDDPVAAVQRLAVAKARSVAEIFRNREDNGGSPANSQATGEKYVIIGADTVAECGGEVLGKPADREDAKRILATLRGKRHRVLTGLCLWEYPEDRYQVQVAESVLWMRLIDDSELEGYLDSGLWHGKAGAFGFQDGPPWLELLSGSESNVVGLPMELLGTMLKQ